MPQVLLDEDAKRLLDIEKQRLRENGRPGASLSDAVRSLDQLRADTPAAAILAAYIEAVRASK